MPPPQNMDDAFPVGWRDSAHGHSGRPEMELEVCKQVSFQVRTSPWERGGVTPPI